MEELNLKDIVDYKIKTILNSEKYKGIEQISRGYTLPEKILCNSILFIGINPSFDVKKNEAAVYYYDLYCKENIHNYFKKFQYISDNVNQPWAHIDLLFVRETEQKKVKEIIYDDKNNGAEFIYEQLLVSKHILEACSPKIIIVANTLARRLLGKDKTKKDNIWMGLDFKMDKNVGTYRIINNEKLANTPVFFTSMLSGQRALDMGSYERLIWHIGFVLKNN